MKPTKFNYRFVLNTLGFILIIESLFMMLATLFSFYVKEVAGDALLLSCSITFIAGILFRLIGTDDYEKPIGKRESFLLVTLIWVTLSAFGTLPYYLSGAIPNIADAYFETMSGFTTTGATILTDIEAMPKGLLLWRSITQWIGAIGIIVFALAILPMMGGNASVLYDAETTGIVHDRFRPRVAQVAKRIWAVYIVLTAILITLLWVGPMSLFDSVCHGLSTMSTGGFSTKELSIAYWDSPYVEYVISTFMFVGGINFALIFFLFKGLPGKLFKNEEFRWYLSIAVLIIIIVASGLYFTEVYEDIELAFRTSLFQIISVMSTTGYTTASYMNWGPFYTLIFCILMLFCASAGSTSGGIKIVRLMVLSKNAVNEFKRQVHPNAILPVRINNQVVPTDIVTKVLAFIFLYIAILFLSFLFLTFMGAGFEEAIGAAISCMGNVGIGLGEHGHNGHFANLPMLSKLYLAFIMLVGRLEMFTVLSLFMPAFWRR